MATSGASLPPPPRRFDQRVVALIVALALVLALGVAAAVAHKDNDENKRASATTSSTSTTATTGAASTTSNPPTTTLAPAQARTMQQLQAQVSELRGLPWKAPLDIAVVPRAQFQRELRAVNDRDQREDRLAGDGDLYRLLKLIPRNLDYSKALDDLYDSAVVGFYDPKTKKLLVGAKSADDLSPASKVTIVHEMDHALTDQHFAFGPRTDALDAADKGEELLGLIGLLEGDAKVLEGQWSAKYLTARERQSMSSGSDLSAFYRMPKYLQHSLLYPYTSGQALVVRLFEETTSWRSVNAAYKDPPRSTEDVIHLDRYKARRGWVPPPLPAPTGAGCTAVRAGTLGEFNMIEVLDENLSLTDAVNGADGWNGDSFHVVRCGAALAMVDRWEADNEAEAAQFADALAKWARAWSSGAAPSTDGRFSGSGGAGRVVRTGTRVDLVVADDAPTADKVGAASGI